MKSSVQSVILDGVNPVVKLENVTYVHIRNIGANDCEIETQYGGTIYLPSQGAAIQVFAPVEKSLNETWRALFVTGPTKVHVLYTYHGKNR